MKWYLDVAGEDGAVGIAYWTELRWRRVRLHAASLLVATPAGQVRQRSTLRAGDDDVSVDPGGVQLACRPLGLAGAWRGRPGGEPVELWSGPAGQAGGVRWECLLPAAPATLSAPGFSVAGTGYVERLELTAPPWKLPLRRLRWGRFTAPAESLVWIDWEGPHAASLALHGRERLPLDAAGEDAVAAGGGRVSLALDGRTPLRGGALGEGPLRRLASILPRRFLSVDERKWRSRGKLTVGGRSRSGWVIHEVVTWR